MKNKNRNLSRIFWSSVFALTLSTLVIIGWIFDIAVLKTVLPDYVSMKLNTALLFLTTSVALILVTKKKAPKLAFFLAALTTFVGALSFSQDIFNINFGIDEYFIKDVDALIRYEKSPGRPSPTTAVCFILFGIVLMLLPSKTNLKRKICQFALHTISLIAFVAILGYLFNIPAFYKLSFFTSMAIHTSATFLVLSVSASFYRPRIGITGLFSGDMIGNLMARSLFKKVVVAILALGFVQLMLGRYGLISAEFGVAIFTTSFMVVVVFALWSTAQVLNRIDIEREKAESQLLENNKNLEKIVKERTDYLSRQNEQLEDFAHIVSHNLRGPTSNLKSLLHFYYQEETIEEKEDLMDKFDKTVNNLESTLNELLEVVSIRHESKREKEKLHFEKILAKLTETFQGKIMETNAKITYDFSKVESIEYSSVYLESIMQNLLSNSIKYRSHERNPEIHFETSLINENPCLIVSDNGLGINMKRNGKKLFGLHKTFHRHPQAKGVGLFITKAQVEAMGGSISAESVLNEGTSFIVQF